MAVMVDSSVLLDVLTQDRQWYAWSQEMLTRHAAAGMLVINIVVYAELAPDFAQRSDLDAELDPVAFELRPISRDAAFLAAKAFAEYRRRGGTKTAPLPDFFIGAHASVEGLDLLTRDPARVRTYFPRVKLICP